MRCKNVGLALTLLSLALVIGACGTDVETIFVERPFFDDPPATASGFLGYGNVEAAAANFPVCGNCHIGKQSEWENTAHSDAWNTLQASGGAQVFCENCHTVSENGNAATGDVAWTATADPRYVDVQCESCHGPGAGHVSNPDASQPLASIAVGVDLTSGCGECHSGTHHPFLDEWAESRHGFGATLSIRERDTCNACHEGRKALEAFGVDANYIERDGAEFIGIVCSVCHDPHGSNNPNQLRFPIDVPDVETNLCMKCHHKRAEPDLNSQQRGPHSPQGPLLLGQDVGWIPPNFAYDETLIIGTHGTTANTRLCATCHVTGREIEDPLTGDFLFNATGHSFKPIPCLDAQGVPTSEEICDVNERSFFSCTTAGCHGTEDAARSAYLVAQTRIGGLVTDLDAQLVQVPSTEFDSDDTVLTVAEGALFNQRLGAITSSAVHNPFLTEALLLGSMQAVFDEYGISARLTSAQIAARMQEITIPSSSAR